MACAWFAWYVARTRYHHTSRQIEEISLYLVISTVGAGTATWLLATRRSRREREWPHPPLVISPKRDERSTRHAWSQDAVVLGYDVHRQPWLWPDKVRVMQGIVLGMTGGGKTTLLRNIITQDLARVVGPSEGPHRIPMVIFDGKGDLEFFYDLLPHIHRAGRLHQLRVLNPARPDVSVLYNPFHCNDDDYMPVVNMVFGSFNLHQVLCQAPAQLSGRHRAGTGVHRLEVQHVLVMAIDDQVLQELVEKATHHIEHDPSITAQRRLNFEMSVKNLYQSFQDRERVPKIQGLLNECMTFLDDEIFVITGPYEDLLSIDEVIEQELPFANHELHVLQQHLAQGAHRLRVLVQCHNRIRERRATATGQPPHVQRRVGRVRAIRLRNFAQILQTARGTNTAFLFSMHSLPQLMQVGRGFKEDFTSAPNTP
jgi:hypothetical protein